MASNCLNDNEDFQAIIEDNDIPISKKKHFYLLLEGKHLINNKKKLTNDQWKEIIQDKIPIEIENNKNSNDNENIKQIKENSKYLVSAKRYFDISTQNINKKKKLNFDNHIFEYNSDDSQFYDSSDEVDQLKLRVKRLQRGSNNKDWQNKMFQYQIKEQAKEIASKCKQIVYLNKQLTKLKQQLEEEKDKVRQLSRKRRSEDKGDDCGSITSRSKITILNSKYACNKKNNHYQRKRPFQKDDKKCAPIEIEENWD